MSYTRFSQYLSLMFSINFPILIHADMEFEKDFKLFAFTPADIQGLHFKAGHGAERRIGELPCLESHGLL